MATYITSDAHGHLRALDAVLAQATPGADDTIYVLGDMIDRGPDPLGVIKLVRSLPGARVLKGNHEQLMLDALLHPTPTSTLTWEMNGGVTTADALELLPETERGELLDWILHLPLWDIVEVGDRRCGAGMDSTGATPAVGSPLRTYLLAHAGIDSLRARSCLVEAGVDPAYATVEDLRDMMARQTGDDLLWIRDGYLGEHTGLVGADGRGPVVVSGHTPSVYLGRFSDQVCGETREVRELGRICELGASRETGGEADRIDIDCSAAAGYPVGRVGVMRLEDRATWYARIEEGE